MALPLLPLPYVAGRLVTHARMLWLLGVLTLGIVWLVPVAPWLSLVGLWFLARWPQEADPPQVVPSLVQWAAVGATWGLLREVPAAAWPWVPWAWLAVAGWQVWVLTARRLALGGRQKGSFGSPAITALYLALVAPFCPWWAWPVLLLGLGLIASWLAFVALAAGVVLLWPGSWLLMAAGGLLVAILWCWSPEIGGQRILEWTPRGDTIDSLVSRARGWQLIIHYGRARWLLGHGPNTTERALLAWGSKHGLELCWGEAFNEPLQLWYEYGILGVAAGVAFCLPIVVRLETGDPWSAAWVVGLVLALGHWPLRHPSIGLVWLTISAALLTR